MSAARGLPTGAPAVRVVPCRAIDTEQSLGSEHRSPARGSREGGLGARCWPEHPGARFKEPGGDHPRGGRLLRWAAESLARTFVARPGERAVQHARGREVKRLAVLRMQRATSAGMTIPGRAASA